jgi:hypothetical protein
MEMLGNHMEQLDRAGRYLSRMRYAYQGIQEPTLVFTIEDPRDDCISFFMHCYHIKDWVQHLCCHTKEQKQAVEDFINQHEELKICADICNGSKHYKLRSIGRYRSGEPQSVEVVQHEPITYLTGSGGLEVHKCQFAEESEGASHDALRLAEKCMELWGGYVAKFTD